MTSVAERPRPLTATDAARTDRILVPLAMIVTFVAGMHTDVIYGLTTSCLLSLLLLPLWLPFVLRCRGGAAFLVIGVVTLAWGLALMVINDSSHLVDSRNAFSDTFMLLGILAGVGGLVWARRILPLATLGVLYGFGVLVQEFLTTSPNAVSNAVKHFWLFPLAIIFLALTSRARTAWPDVWVLTGLAALCAFTGSRSYAGALGLALLLRLWQLRPRNTSRQASAPDDGQLPGGDGRAHGTTSYSRCCSAVTWASRPRSRRRRSWMPPVRSSSAAGRRSPARSP